MEANRKIMALAFALIMTTFWFIMVANFTNPFLHHSLAKTDDKIALYVDAFSVVEEGEIKIPLGEGTVLDIRINYEKKEDDERDYDITTEGWYAVVNYDMGAGGIKSASRINTYPLDMNFEKMFFAPNDICVTKSKDTVLAEVREC